jgi:hypothetical protein
MNPDKQGEQGPHAPIGFGGEERGPDPHDDPGGRTAPSVTWTNWAVIWMAVLAVIVLLAAIALIVF